MSSDMGFVAKSKKDVWQTPASIWEPIDERVTIDLDPCAGPETEIGTENIRPSEGDGLAVPWYGTVFVNPPFSEKGDWLEYAVEQYLAGNVERVFLVTPDSTDVKGWWHPYIADHCRFTWFKYGRLNYVDPDTGEQSSGVSFGTAISVLGSIPPSLEAYWRENGDLVMRTLGEI